MSLRFAATWHGLGSGSSLVFEEGPGLDRKLCDALIGGMLQEWGALLLRECLLLSADSHTLTPATVATGSEAGAGCWCWCCWCCWCCCCCSSCCSRWQLLP